MRKEPLKFSEIIYSYIARNCGIFFVMEQHHLTLQGFISLITPQMPPLNPVQNSPYYNILIMFRKEHGIQK